jgi:hypothetical protein
VHVKAAGSASSALDGLKEVTSPTRHHQINLDINYTMSRPTIDMGIPRSWIRETRAITLCVQLKYCIEVKDHTERYSLR